MPRSTVLTTLLGLMGSAHLASAHMEMLYPPPIRSKFNPIAKAAFDIDHDMTSPLASASDFPCKGYNTKYAGTDMMTSMATFEPGSTHNFTITGGAFHDGGSCQASLSYDKGKTFTVIQSIEGECPGQGESSFDFTVPADAPKGDDVLFAWTWFNKVGNREMYMNCASVTIGGGGDKKRDELVGRDSFTSRPEIMVANVGTPACSTPPGKDILFPNPGPDLVKNDGDFAEPEGDCGGSGAGNGSESGSPSAARTGGDGGSGATTTPEATRPTTPAGGASKSSSLNGGVFVTVGESSSSSSSAPAATTLATTTKGGANTTQTSSAPLGTGTGTGPGSDSGEIAPGTPCSDEGAWNCIAGTSFQRCASGTWSVTLDMAAGTICQPGGVSNAFEISHRPTRRSRRGGARRARSAWA